MRSMTGWITRAAASALALGVFACANAQAPVLVGATLPQTGVLADLGEDYRRGLLLWQDELNAAGGLLGRRVELRLRDDASEAVRTASLYRDLLRDDKVDLLLGPYGVAATLMAAAEAETARRVMVHAAGPSSAIHKRAPRFVFQAGVPYSSYGEGVLALAKERGYRRLYLIARDDPVAFEMATATREAAQALGMDTGEIEIHATGLEDFSPLVARARSRQAEAWIAFGELRDAAEMIKSMKRASYAPPLFFARAAADPRLFSLVGQDAELALGALAYDPRLATPSNAQFAKAYAARYSASPSLAAAQGYAAGTVLAAAVRQAGTLEADKLRATLASQAIGTVLGVYKADPKTGRDVGAGPAITQVQKGRVQVVWPGELQEAKVLLPYPAWSERVLLKPR